MAGAVMRHISRTTVDLYVLAEIKGWFAEKKVSIVLEDLKERKIIKDGGASRKFGYDDGILKTDHFIYPWDGKEIKIQVKSSYNPDAERMCKQHEIYFLVVPPQMDFWEIEGRILEILDKEEKKENQNQNQNQNHRSH